MRRQLEEKEDDRRPKAPKLDATAPSKSEESPRTSGTAETSNGGVGPDRDSPSHHQQVERVSLDVQSGSTLEGVAPRNDNSSEELNLRTLWSEETDKELEPSEGVSFVASEQRTSSKSDTPIYQPNVSGESVLADGSQEQGMVLNFQGVSMHEQSSEEQNFSESAEFPLSQGTLDSVPSEMPVFLDTSKDPDHDSNVLRKAYGSGLDTKETVSPVNTTISTSESFWNDNRLVSNDAEPSSCTVEGAAIQGSATEGAASGRDTGETSPMRGVNFDDIELIEISDDELESEQCGSMVSKTRELEKEQ